jgi:Leucine-rich repeat (LRR) protein
VAVVHNVPSTEIDALYDLYESTGGSYWDWHGTRNRWNFTAPNPCVGPWQGVTCSVIASAGFVHVLQLELPRYKLAGTIPQSVANLTQLQVLNLVSNNLRGDVPETAGLLSELQNLDLSTNQLTGVIPITLGLLVQLNYLDLSANRLRGTIPESLGQLLQLSTLNLYRNLLTGAIPSSIGQLTQLTELSVGKNGLIGSVPNSLGQLVRLTVLNLEDNQLTGTIPGIFGQLDQLSVLLFGSNGLRGTIPESLGQLTLLTQLTLSINQLTGSIPGSLGQLPLLGDLELDGNNLGGAIPESLGQLSQLTSLYMNSNRLTGTIPSSLGRLTQLVELSLYSNHLSGTIPDSFCQLLNLTVLYLYQNEITGTIPSSLDQLEKLTELLLEQNYLRGTIPDSLGQLAQLTLLYLEENELTGTIPDSLSQLDLMSKLDLGDNYVSGSIPESLGQLTQLTVLYLWVNQLTGTIPSSLGQLKQLNQLGLQYCRLSGTVPESLGQLTQLEVLYLEGNELTGTIPSILGQLTVLAVLELNENNFIGSIPSSFGQLPFLTLLHLYDNKLTGTVPDLSACRLLDDFSAESNYLSGTLPEYLFWLPAIQYLSFQNNGFTGTLPEQALNGTARKLQVLLCDNNMLTGALPNRTFAEVPLLQLGLSNNRFSGTVATNLIRAVSAVDFLLLDNNQLTGTIPQNWSATTGTLSYLYLHENRLSGTIPESLGHMPRLQNLNLSSNRLTGTIPGSFQQLVSLQVLMLHNNQLRGNIANLFSSMQANLSTVQLSGNQLTGTLPAAAFLLPSLSSFAAVHNCFEGPLPEEAICSSSSLSALVLDGLHSAPLCKHATSLSHPTFKIGTVPPCLLTLPSLATLHLSGSGLTGSLPATASIGVVLADLSLSHNLLTGYIPHSILERDWDKLDLSYNRLTGTLHSAGAAPYSDTTQIHLQHNRLSGVIPGSMQRVGDLSLLENNMFSCRVDRSDVPQQNPNSDKYTCGSVAVNNALFAWLGATVAVAAAAVYVAYRFQNAKHWFIWVRAVRDAELRKLDGLFRTVHMVYALGTGSAAYCVFVLVPVWAAVNAYNPSFTYKYAWTVSGVFLAGTTAFALETVFLLLQLPICAYAAEQLAVYADPQLIHGGADADAHATTATTGLSTAGMRHTLASTAVMLISLVVVTGVNITFVIATLRLNGKQLTAVQVLLAVFKLGFNNVVVPALESRVEMLGNGRSTSTAVRLLLVLLNVIVIPCLVVIVISPACFYDALKGTDPVTSSYEYSGDCLSFRVVTDQSTGAQTLTCAGAQTAVDTTTYTPPFTYSYQCSSSFVTSYAPTFVIMCIISGFVVPAQRLLLMWLRSHLSSASRLYSIVTAATPRILKELSRPQDLAQACSERLYRPVFDANKLVMSLLTYLALLLTFGALFPPLAVCCAAAMASVVLAARLEVGRYVCAAVAADRQDCLDEMESACAGVATPQQLRIVLYLVLAVSCMFYTLFLFDTLGYEVGFAGAFWVLIVVPLLPMAAWALHASAVRLSSTVKHPRSSVEVGVELGSMHASADPAVVSESVAEIGPRKDGQLDISSANPMHEP